MQVKFDDNDKFQQNKFFAVKDRAERNKINEAKHTEADLAKLDDLVAKVQAAYIRSRIFRNVNVNGLGVKVYKPSISDKVSEAVHSLNAALGDSVEMTVNKKGDITYNFTV